MRAVSVDGGGHVLLQESEWVLLRRSHARDLGQVFRQPRGDPQEPTKGFLRDGIYTLTVVKGLFIYLAGAHGGDTAATPLILSNKRPLEEIVRRLPANGCFQAVIDVAKVRADFDRRFMRVEACDLHLVDVAPLMDINERKVLRALSSRFSGGRRAGKLAGKLKRNALPAHYPPSRGFAREDIVVLLKRTNERRVA